MPHSFTLLSTRRMPTGHIHYSELGVPRWDCYPTQMIPIDINGGYKTQQGYLFKPEYIGGYFYAGDFERRGCVPHVVQGRHNSTIVHIDLLESQDGNLVYRSDQPLADAGKTITWLSTISFLPFGADEDGKTSLLVATKNLSGNLQVQMLRSTGPSLLPPTAPIVTDIAYSGHLTLARTTTPLAVDLVNTFATVGGSTNVDVLRFANDSFVKVAGVTQPGVHSSTVSWADLRGIGRADCVLSSLDFSGKMSIAPCPVRLSSLSTISLVTRTGLARRSALHTHHSAIAHVHYRRDFSVQRNWYRVPAASCQWIGSTISDRLLPFLRRQAACHAPYAAKPGLVDETVYTYKNARYSYDGRGWQGFESVDKISRSLGSQVTTAYYQDFPLVGQIKSVTCVLANTSTLLQTTTNSWQPVAGNGGKNQYIALSAVKESFYEGGIPTYDVDVSYENDAYGNITTTTIQTQSSKSPLTILSEYANDVHRGS
ncbi:hypothetical protein IMY05_C4904000300 [Salix suchowensis]|nr:hypothetical protein IMY05_C4904000300 [Salix suchowensis]